MSSSRVDCCDWEGMLMIPGQNYLKRGKQEISRKPGGTHSAGLNLVRLETTHFYTRISSCRCSHRQRQIGEKRRSA